MNIRDRKFRGVATAAVFAVTLAALAGALFALPQDQSGKTKEEESIVRVEAKYVCMINDQRFNKEQIAVEVGGQTYYGCCEMCKTKLRDDAGSRSAVDPVSGKKVDKARAVIGSDAEGNVFYFENADNLKKFKTGAKPAGGAKGEGR